MIDKKQLIEDLLEYVNDTTDTQTAITGMTMCAMLMNEVIDQALTLTDVSQQRELFDAVLDFSEELPMCTEDYHRSELWEKYKALNFG